MKIQLNSLSSRTRLVTGAALVAALPGVYTAGRGGEMEEKAQDRIKNKINPSVDMVVSSRVETATFALG